MHLKSVLKPFNTILVLMLVSKKKWKVTHNLQSMGFYFLILNLLDLMWPYFFLTIVTKNSPGFSPISQASHFPFPLLIQIFIFKSSKFFAFSVTLYMSTYSPKCPLLLSLQRKPSYILQVSFKYYCLRQDWYYSPI